MKRLLIAIGLVAATAQGQTKFLIVHADDLGMAHSVNLASIVALDTGLVTSASIMVPCPWFPEIARYAREHPNADLGLHLTLTSEWTLFRWRPLLGLNSLLDSSGYLYATESDAAAHIDPKDAEAEIRAQIARARAAGIRPTHLDSHMGVLYQNKALIEVFMRVAQDEKIPARITSAQGGIIDRIISIPANVPPEKWAEWYRDEIRKIEPGVTEIIVHLALDDAEMRAITADHPNWGSAWRRRDFDFFTSDEFRRLLSENDIRLITWREAAKR